MRVAVRLLEVETINAVEFEALMRGEEPVDTRNDGWREHENALRRAKNEGSVRGDDKRTDNGLDLNGRLPQPA